MDSILDKSKYKTLQVKRGFTYRYYVDLPQNPEKHKPTLFFVHGFPSSSIDWNRQITYFTSQGYGVLSPDLLGAGQSSKPTEAGAYTRNALAQDIIEILDHEGIMQVVGVAHDWGTGVLARLATNHADRFLGFGWVAIPFIPSNTAPFELEQVNERMKAFLGYESYAYWDFFLQEDAASVIAENLDSFIQLMYPRDPSSWFETMVLPHNTEEFVRGNKKPGFAHYLTDAELDAIHDDIRKGDMQARLSMYHAQVQNVDLEDNKRIPQHNWTLRKPTVLFACSKEAIWPPKLAIPTLHKWAKDVEVVLMETGHWAFLEDSDRFNEELRRWVDAKFSIAQ